MASHSIRTPPRDHYFPFQWPLSATSEFNWLIPSSLSLSLTCPLRFSLHRSAVAPSLHPLRVNCKRRSSSSLTIKVCGKKWKTTRSGYYSWFSHPLRVSYSPDTVQIGCCWTVPVRQQSQSVIESVWNRTRIRSCSSWTTAEGINWRRKGTASPGESQLLSKQSIYRPPSTEMGKCPQLELQSIFPIELFLHDTGSQW